MEPTDERMFASGLPAAELAARARQWVEDHVPETWRRAACQGGAAAIREVRTRADYEAWYPVFATSGLVAPTWPVAYGGAGLTPSEARTVEVELAPYNLGRLNPLGLSLAAPALLLRDRGAAAAVPRSHRAERGDLVPAVQRARGRFRLGVAGHPGRAGR